MPPLFDPIAPRTVWALTLLGLAPIACGSEGAAERAPLVAPAMTVEPSPTGDGAAERVRAEETAVLLSWLREQSLDESRFHTPRTLFTWTRAEQIAELRETPVLLTRTHGANGQASAFDQALEGDRSPLARHLTGSARARRFAWTSPWATRMGWAEGDYGDRLVRVELRSSAWIARFDPSASGDARWEVRDAAGQPVAGEALRSEPGRVAAVYHASEGQAPDGTARVFREYVLVSEPMIERFVVGADAERLARDRAQLRVLADRFRALGASAPDLAAWTRALPARFRADEPQADLPAFYESALALGSERYLPDSAHVEAIASALEIPVEPLLERSPEPPAEATRARSSRVRPPHPAPSVWCDPTMGCRPIRRP